MKQDEKFNITTIPFGYNKLLFVPLDDNRKYSNALGLFVKTDGEFAELITFENLDKHIPETTPVVALKFKNKKAINDAIKFLRMYRDTIYKKPYDEVE